MTVKLSAINAPGHIAGATDLVVGVRSGTTDEQFETTALTWINVQAHGVLPANSTSVNSTNLNSLIQTVKATLGFVLYFPTGTYNFGSLIELSQCFCFSFIGDGAAEGTTNGGTVLVGSFSGTFLNINYGSLSGGDSGRWYFRDMQIINKAIDGTALFTFNSDESKVERCGIQGGRGATWNDNTSVTNVGISSQNFSAMWSNIAFSSCGIGLAIGSGGGGEACHSCDFSSCNEGFRAQGSGGSTFATRYEVCTTAMNLGVMQNGTHAALLDVCYEGMSMEGNVVGISILGSLGASTISGVGCKMDTSRGQETQYGLYIGAAGPTVLIQNSNFGGSALGAAVKFAPGSQVTSLTFLNVQATNGDQKIWDIPDDPDNVILINCPTYLPRPDDLFSPDVVFGSLGIASINRRNLLNACVQGKNLCQLNVPVPVGNSSVASLYNTSLSAGNFDANLTQTTGGNLILLGTYYVTATLMGPLGEGSGSEHSITLTGSNNAIVVTPNSTISSPGFYRRRYYISDGTTDMYGNRYYSGYYDTNYNDPTAMTITSSVISGGTIAFTNTSPIQVTNGTNPVGTPTASNHELATGQTVLIAGANVSAANGTWVITVVDAQNFTLNGSTASGAQLNGQGKWNLVLPLTGQKGPPPSGTNHLSMQEPNGYYSAIATPSWLTTLRIQQNQKMTTGVVVEFGTPAVAPIITGSVAATSNTTPIKVTTVLAHCLQIGQTVVISGTGDTNANVTAVVATVPDGFSFTLTGTTADGGAGAGGTWALSNAITNVTGANHGAMMVTTAVPHGLCTGQAVIVSGVGGMTQANTTANVQVLSPTTFVLIGPTASTTAYTSGGTWVPAATVDIEFKRG